MVKITIDGKEFQAEEGKTILHVARAHNIYIPTLCYNEAVEAYGGCRLCMVEITTSRGRNRLVTSCLYPVEEGLKVQTDTQRVKHVRKMVIELLAARCPDSEVIQELAGKLGAKKQRFIEDEGKGKCILCALCTRACKEVVGASAISLVNRGVDREMSTPFHELSETCIACGSCAYICPTHAIDMEDKGDTRIIKMPTVTQKFKMKKCGICGRYWAPEKQLDVICKQAGLPADFFDKCPDCRD